jgi:ferritin-like protein
MVPETPTLKEKSNICNTTVGTDPVLLMLAQMSLANVLQHECLPEDKETM